MHKQQYIKSNHFEYGVDTGIKKCNCYIKLRKLQFDVTIIQKEFTPDAFIMQLSKTAKVVHCLSSAAVLILSIMF